MIDLVSTFIVFFAVVDPIGTVPVFIAVTSRYAEREKRRIAIQATVISALVLLFFVIAGEIILTAIAIPLAAFQVAGGIVLFSYDWAANEAPGTDDDPFLQRVGRARFVGP